MLNEKIFDITDNRLSGKYRLVCTYGKQWPYFAWWMTLEREETKKKFWSRPKNVWVKVTEKWIDHPFADENELKEIAMSLYNDYATGVETLLRQINL